MWVCLCVSSHALHGLGKGRFHADLLNKLTMEFSCLCTGKASRGAVILMRKGECYGESEGEEGCVRGEPCVCLSSCWTCFSSRRVGFCSSLSSSLSSRSWQYYIVFSSTFFLALVFLPRLARVSSSLRPSPMHKTTFHIVFLYFISRSLSHFHA